MRFAHADQAQDARATTKSCGFRSPICRFGATSGGFIETKRSVGLRLRRPNAYNDRPDCLKIEVVVLAGLAQIPSEHFDRSFIFLMIRLVIAFLCAAAACMLVGSALTTAQS